MQIRGTSQHAQCGTCVRHRHLIKSLGRHLLARTQQQTFYWQHLRDQYLDRLQYYRLRSLSRLQDGRFICIIQDGMDQAKVSLPRSPWMQSKEFSQFKIHRPKLHVSLTLVHGYFTLWTISHPDTMKDSNASVETMAHALHLLESEHGVCLRGCSLSIHADNTCREVKNNPFLRWAALQTSCGNFKNVSVRFLRTGHSHEDVDQAFGRLARHLSRLKVAQEPSDFLDSIKQFASGMGRPHEAHNYVTIMAQTRDWILNSVGPGMMFVWFAFQCVSPPIVSLPQFCNWISPSWCRHSDIMCQGKDSMLVQFHFMWPASVGLGHHMSSLSTEDLMKLFRAMPLTTLLGDGQSIQGM